MLFWLCIVLIPLLTTAQRKGSVTPNFIPSLPITSDSRVLSTGITLDANWRWLHKNNGYDNCFSNGWDASVCSDPVQCTKNCLLEGVDQQQYRNSYGISVDEGSKSVTLRYVTQGPYGRNVGSRIYVLDESKEKYYGFDLLGKEISITVDISKLPCGLNGAVYLAEMPLDGGKNELNTAGAPYGTGYGDAQCPKDIKFIHGFSNLNNTGACSNEIDLWEANAYSAAFTLHPCSVPQVYGCGTAQTCGDGSFRYSGVCDKDGGDYNPYRFGIKTLYGKGSQFQVDSSKPFEMVTQFITEKGKLVRIKRLYRQDGKTIEGGELTDSIIRNFKSTHGETDHYSKLGGLATIEASLRRKHVLVLSVWDDSSPAQMRWLDSTYPVGSTKTADVRGPCPVSDDRNVESLRARFAEASVTYGNIQVRSLTSSPTQAPTKKPTKKPTQGIWKCSECLWVQV